MQQPEDDKEGFPSLARDPGRRIIHLLPFYRTRDLAGRCDATAVPMNSVVRAEGCVDCFSWAYSRSYVATPHAVAIARIRKSSTVGVFSSSCSCIVMYEKMSESGRSCDRQVQGVKDKVDAANFRFLPSSLASRHATSI